MSFYKKTLQKSNQLLFIHNSVQKIMKN